MNSILINYRYGILASVIISLLSVVGAASIPLQNRHRGLIMQALVSFAVGALLGDAVLHLIPNILGVSCHSNE